MDQWTCTRCTCINGEGDARCAACETPRDVPAEPMDGSQDSDDSGSDSEYSLWLAHEGAGGGEAEVTSGSRAASALCRSARQASSTRWTLAPDLRLGRFVYQYDLLQHDLGSCEALGLKPEVPLSVSLSFVSHSFEVSELQRGHHPDLLATQPGLPRYEPQERGTWLPPRSFPCAVYLPGVYAELLAAWPGPSVNFFSYIGNGISDSLDTALRRCAVCRTPLATSLPLLRVCPSDGCAFVFEEASGLDVPLLPLLQGAGASLQIAFASTAVNSPRAASLLEPFPSFLLESPEKRGRAGIFDALAQAVAGQAGAAAAGCQVQTSNKELGVTVMRAILHSIPPVHELGACSCEAQLRDVLRAVDWVSQLPTPETRKQATELWAAHELTAMPRCVVRYILATARHRLQPLDESAARINPGSACSPAPVQLALLGGDEAREAEFAARKAAAGGSYFAFHGAPLDSWFSISRNGLRTLSGTQLQANGAAYGAGVYLGGQLAISYGYAQSRHLAGAQGGCGTDRHWGEAMSLLRAPLLAGIAPERAAAAQRLGQCVAVVEIVNGGAAQRHVGYANSGAIIVAPDARSLAVRYLLILPESNLTTTPSRAPELGWADSTLHAHLDWLSESAQQAAAERRSAMLRARPPPPPELAAAAAQDAAVEMMDAAAHLIERGAPGGASCSSAMRAIARELRTFSRAAPGLDMRVTLPDENDATLWEVKMYGWEFCAPLLAQDLSRAGVEAVELRIQFPASDFPFAPPFVRVHRPIFAFHTGHITVGGSICSEILTRSGWTPATSVESLLANVRADMVCGNARLDMNRLRQTYSEAEARDAFNRVARQHGWE